MVNQQNIAAVHVNTDESMEKYEKTLPAHGDKLFHHLISRIQRSPGQLMRYNLSFHLVLPISALCYEFMYSAYVLHLMGNSELLWIAIFKGMIQHDKVVKTFNEHNWMSEGSERYPLT